IKRREHEQVAGVVKMEQVLVGHEAQEADAVADAGFLGGLPNLGRKPSLIARQCQPVAKLRETLHNLAERFKQTDLVLPRVQISDQRSRSAHEVGKNSGCSRKLTSCTLTTTGTGQNSGALYWTCSRSGRSRRSLLDRSNPRRTNGLGDTRRTAKRAGTQGEG